MWQCMYCNDQNLLHSSGVWSKCKLMSSVTLGSCSMTVTAVYSVQKPSHAYPFGHMITAQEFQGVK